VACGELFEVEYPGWGQRGGPDRPNYERPNPGALKWLWRERRSSSETVDRSGVWRFRELLPILDSFGDAVTLFEGNTPLYPLTRAAKSLGIDQLYAKHQGMNPSGSFKDTGMTAAMSVARERGFEWVACASTGNTSAAMAAYAARAGLKSLVLIPEGKIAWGKLSQAMDYGSLTCQLKADFDGCLTLLTQIVKEAPIYLLNSVNPYRLEGQKSTAFEIYEQLGFSVPDYVVLPVGNAGNISAIWKGFKELRDFGITEKVPRMVGVQAVGASPIARAFWKGSETITPVDDPNTVASAIRIGKPASAKKALAALRESEGMALTVTDEEITAARSLLSSKEGIFVEPASAAPIAALREISGKLEKDAVVVCVCTGNGLKDQESIRIDIEDAPLVSDRSGLTDLLERLASRPLVPA
jgi:threonine synthase